MTYILLLTFEVQLQPNLQIIASHNLKMTLGCLKSHATKRMYFFLLMPEKDFFRFTIRAAVSEQEARDVTTLLDLLPGETNIAIWIMQPKWLTMYHETPCNSFKIWQMEKQQ